MSLSENINTLLSAEALKVISEAAPLKLEKEAITRQINLAANTGETSVTWMGSIDDSIISELEDLGYKVESENEDKHYADNLETVFYVISWE